MLKRFQFHNFSFALLFATVIWPVSLPAQDSSPFPYASPESQGISSTALDELSNTIQWYYDNQMIVGAEFLVIKNRRTVFHEAYGWKDRETQRRMESNTIFNVRSMTKPFTGAAAQILIDEGKLQLDDPVYLYLSGFDNDRSREITIRQLLTHRSGLPLSMLMNTPMSAFANIIELANETGRRGPEFIPDSKFWYSDAGSEVLGAVVETVSGLPLHQFITERLLEPLGMADSISYHPHAENDPRWNRIASLYRRYVGNWTRLWRPGEPFYLYTLGSQSLYSTPMDYARFLAMWMDSGICNETRILTQEAVHRILSPVSVMTNLGADTRFSSGFPNMYTYYGQMSVLYSYSSDTSGKAVVVGHSGSDGTWAWAWPEQDLMVLYFTQSRGQASGITLETLLDRLLIDSHQEVEIPEHYQPYIGTYTGNLFGLWNIEIPVFVQNGALSFALPGITVFEVKEPDRTGKWRTTLTNDIAISFPTNAAGEVDRLWYYEGSQQAVFRKEISVSVDNWFLLQ
ncbi:MAG: class A beta-lactamase-related serine hydrolase [Candidatus Omnitrophota bacterium]|jgi:CubicO group peptidase (beta-lactamase class C family)|nr:MAG: class A beta-lactamase-related serine hydrolase [Candidatus Omnitrophota bacterium]